MANRPERHTRLKKHRQATNWVAASVAASAAITVAGSIVSKQVAGWTFNHVALHAFVETVCGGIALAVALLLLAMHRLGRGNRSNLPIGLSLATTAWLSGLLSIADPGETSVCLHSLTTFAGGLLAAFLWLPERNKLVHRAALATSAMLVCLGIGLLLASVFIPNAIEEPRFNQLSNWLNCVGGLMMLMAAVRLAASYRKGQTFDDVLFATHFQMLCGAAILFQFTEHGNFDWWWFHGLRLLAYGLTAIYALRIAFALQLEGRELSQLLNSERLQAREASVKAEVETQQALAKLGAYNRQVALEGQVLRTIVNSIPHAVFWKDTNFVYGGCNQAFANDCGLEGPEDVIGKTDFELPWSTEEAAFFRECDRNVVNRKVIIRNLEEPQTRSNGEERILLTSKSPLIDEDGCNAGIVGSYLDVTEIRRAERERQQLMHESAELAQVIRESPDEVFIFSRESLKFLNVNKGACVSTGYSEEELMAMTPIDLKPEFDELEFRNLIAPLANGEVSHLEFQTNHLKKTGETYPAKISLHTTEFKGESVYVAFVSDVTLVKDLEHRLAASQKLEAIGQLSAGIAHEINTPLQFLSDNISFLSACSERLLKVVDFYQETLHSEKEISWETRREEVLQTETDNQFDRIRKQLPLAISDCKQGIERTVKIINAMKEFSHPGSREATRVQLNEAIESTLTISRNHWKDFVDIQKDLAEDLPAVPAFAADINQVLLNLIVNATDAIAERFADDKRGVIQIKTRVADPWVEIEITDNGCGMPQKICNKIFDPFFTTKAPGKGTGQGLSITHDVIVQLHHGTIEVDSEFGQGTQFIIRLPIHGPASQSGNPGMIDANLSTPVEISALNSGTLVT